MTPDAQPAAQPKRRRLQFSLRTLLIGTAVIAVFCAMGLRWIVPAQRQRAAVKMVEGLGGKVRYAKAPANESWAVGKLRGWLPRDYFDSVTQVSVESDPLGSPIPLQDTELSGLRGLSELQSLDLSNSQVTDLALRHLVGLKKLTRLRLDLTQISDTGLAQLERLEQLHTLGLMDTQISDAGMNHLKGLTQLQKISLDSTQITDAGLVYLAGLGRLKHLTLSYTPITDAGLIHLKELKQLQWLMMDGTQITDAGMVHLAGLHQLRFLSLCDSPITDGALKNFEGLTQLQVLLLSKTQTSDAGAEELQEALPSCKIRR